MAILFERTPDLQISCAVKLSFFNPEFLKNLKLLMPPEFSITKVYYLTLRVLQILFQYYLQYLSIIAFLNFNNRFPLKVNLVWLWFSKFLTLEFALKIFQCFRYVLFQNRPCFLINSQKFFPNYLLRFLEDIRLWWLIQKSSLNLCNMDWFILRWGVFHSEQW